MMKYQYVGHAYTCAEPKRIWDLWSNVKTWQQWDSDVEKVEMKGEFNIGSQGILFPVKGPKSKFVITEIIKNEKFTDVAKLPFANLEFDHFIEKHGNKFKVSHVITLDGLFAPVFNRLFVKRLGNELQNSVNAMVKLAESNEKFS